MLGLSFTKRRRSTARFALQTIPALVVLVALPAVAGTIDHEPAPSVPSGERIEVAAHIEDDAGMAEARLYFKAARETNFLFVGMEPAGTDRDYVGTLPAPAQGTATVQYVVLYRNGGGELFRSPTYEVAVEARSESTAYAEPLDVYTELAKVPDAVAGFQDNLALDVVESTARYGLVAAVDGASMPGTAASSSGGTAGTTASTAAPGGTAGTTATTATTATTTAAGTVGTTATAAAAGAGGLGALGVTAAVGAAVAGAAVAVASDDSSSNAAPEFAQSGTLALQVDEGTTGNIGAPVTATDPDGDRLTYSLTGADAGSFAVNSATAQLSVAAATDLDFETRVNYTFNVVAADSELSASRRVEVTVTDVNEAPAFDGSGTLALQVPEGTTGDIGDPAAATDPDADDLTYSLSGADASSFAVDSATGQLSVPAGTDLDFETRTDYAFDVVASDGDLTASRRVEVTVTDVNEAPAFDESGTLALQVPEGTTGNIGDPAAATDPDADDLTYSLSGADAGSFAVDSATGQLSVPAGTDLDFETRTDYAFDVIASDGDLTASRPVEVAVTDVNEVPAFDESGTVALSVPEGTTGDIGEPVAATDPDGDDLAYSLSGADAALFAVDSATGQLSVLAGTDLDFETRTGYEFDIVVSDGELTASRRVEVTLIDVSELRQDWLALRELFRATNGENWTNNTGWSDSDEEPTATELGNWHGVVVTGDRVTRLDLPENNLTGNVPPELGDLSKLEWLVLVDENLTGGIPPELSRLSNLRALGLGGNLTGGVPPELSRLSNLTVLGLGGNLTGGIPPELGRLSNLEVLILGSNLTGDIPPELGDLSNLRELDLAFNSLTGNIPPELGDLSKLESLELWDNNLTGSIPPELGGLSNLRLLDLEQNSLTGNIPAELGDLSNLEELWLNDNELTGPLPGDLTNLTILNRFYWYAQTVSAGEVALCAPTDDAFQEWLDTIEDRSGPDCEGSSSNPNAPRVAAVALVSSPGPDGAYTVGEVLEVMVRFDRPVAVSGAPRLLLGVGVATAPMALASASGNVLVFIYEVAYGDLDLDGVSVGPAALRLDGGAVIGSDGGPAAAGLSGHAFANDPGHVVDARDVGAERAVLEDALAAQARAHLASVSDVVDGRFRAGPAQDWGAGTLPGRAAVPGVGNSLYDPLAAEARGGVLGVVEPCGADARDAWPANECGAGRFGGASAAERTSFAWSGGFALRLGGEAASGGTTLWSAGDRRAFSGETAAGGYDGDLRSRYLGVDRRFGGWLVGAAVSRSVGEAAYDHSGGIGVLRTSLDVLLPYAGGRLADGLEAWGMAGLGAGDAALVREDTTGEAGKLRLGLAAGGLRREAKDFGWLKLSLLADAGFARLAAAAGQGRVLDGLSASVARLRAGVEGEHALALAGGSLRPFWRATGRVDGGDGIRSTGLELAGGMRYGSPRVDAEVKGHWLAAGLAGSEEFGASATLRIKPLPNRTGFSASLLPRWGAVDGGGRSVWEEPALRADGWKDRRGSPPWSLDGQLGWGMALPRANGVFAPFVDLRLRGTSTLRVGWRLERNVGGSLLGVEFGVGRVERPQGVSGAAELSVEALY